MDIKKMPVIGTVTTKELKYTLTDFPSGGLSEHTMPAESYSVVHIFEDDGQKTYVTSEWYKEYKKVPLLIIESLVDTYQPTGEDVQYDNGGAVKYSDGGGIDRYKTIEDKVKSNYSYRPGINKFKIPEGLLEKYDNFILKLKKAGESVTVRFDPTPREIVIQVEVGEILDRPLLDSIFNNLTFDRKYLSIVHYSQRGYKLKEDINGGYTERNKKFAGRDIKSIPVTKLIYSDGGEVKFIEYKDNEIMFEPHFKEYFVGDEQFSSLEDAQKYIDDGSEPSQKTINVYRHGAMKDGGGVGSDKWQIKNEADKYYSIDMRTFQPTWNESPDLGYSFVKGEAESIKNKLTELGFAGLSVVEYNPNWWKAANGKRIESSVFTNDGHGNYTNQAGYQLIDQFDETYQVLDPNGMDIVGEFVTYEEGKQTINEYMPLLDSIFNVDQVQMTNGGTISDSIDLFFQEGGSDKEYHIQLVALGDGTYVVNFQFGRRGSKLNSGTKTATPVPLDKAQKVYDSLKREKMNKGYEPDYNAISTAAATQVKPQSKTVHILPQLLNPVEDALTYINDDSFLAQEKKDYERRIIISDGIGGIMGLNKKGEEVPVPVNISKSIKDACILDGEISNDMYYVFDIISYRGEDLKSFSATQRLEYLYAMEFGDSVQKIETAYTKAEKEEMLEKLKTERREGIVFKKKSAPYTSGRPNSGGSQLKFKFYKTATFIVANMTKDKRSIGLELIDDNTGDRVFMGKVTIPPNYDIPNIGDFVEVRYLYAYKGGAVYQPTYLGKRNDSDLTDATMKQIIYKAED